MNPIFRLVAGLLATGAILLTGSAVAAEPAAIPTAEAPSARATQIYIFDGLNPLGLARVSRLAGRLRESGFLQTQVVQWYSAPRVEREIRAAHAADPSVQVALVGYSAGTTVARRLANRLLSSGVPVAVVGYVGGDYLSNTPTTQVQGTGRVVNVMGDGYLPTGRNLFFNGTEISGAANMRLSGTRHYGLPTHPTTFTMLYEALLADKSGQ